MGRLQFASQGNRDSFRRRPARALHKGRHSCDILGSEATERQGNAHRARPCENNQNINNQCELRSSFHTQEGEGRTGKPALVSAGLMPALCWPDAGASGGLAEPPPVLLSKILARSLCCLAFGFPLHFVFVAQRPFFFCPVSQLRCYSNILLLFRLWSGLLLEKRM